MILTLKPEHLQTAIAQLPAQYTENCIGEGGNSELACALYLLLLDQQAEPKLRFCLRTEESFDDNTPVTTFSHIVVNALDTNWDEKGTEAKSRWEAQWTARAEARHKFMWKTLKGSDAISQIEAIYRSFSLDELDHELIQEIKNELLNRLSVVV